MTLNQNLKAYNTFAINAHCDKLLPIYSEIDVYKALVKENAPFRILGGGSNILISQDIKATVLHNQIKGISIIDEDADTLLVSVGAGEKWHQLVMWSISHGLGGLENLSWIPGNVGAAPMQNIGAYGVEQCQSFHSLKAIDLVEGTSRRFFKEECGFGYRESVFKGAEKGRYIIVEVNYILTKKPVVNTSYGAIQQRLEAKGIHQPTVQDVSDVVIEIRKEKLPDPALIPNAGSFFKNPIVAKAAYLNIAAEHREVPHYELENELIKIPAAWLIDQAGYKGAQRGAAGTHKNHALVLVNNGGATGAELLGLADEIVDVVDSKFGISLEKEVNIW